MDGDNTPKKTADLKPAWQPGQSGNPKGRPKGARNKLGEEFLNDLLADWEKNGAATIAKVREDRPHEYLKVTASILPKELNVKVTELDDLTDDQLARQLAAGLAALAAAGFDPLKGIGQAEAPQSPGSVPTLQ